MWSAGLGNLVDAHKRRTVLWSSTRTSTATVRRQFKHEEISGAETMHRGALNRVIVGKARGERWASAG